MSANRAWKIAGMVLVLSCIVITRLFSFDWPVIDGKVLSTFGERNGDNFNTGIIVFGDNHEVRSAGSGELIYSAVENEWGLPSGIGNFAVIEHDGGLKTVYGHLKADSIRELPVNIGKEMPIGTVDDSGWTYGNQLRFSVLDTDFKQIVNPLLLLPSLVDMTDPILEGLELNKGGTRISVENNLTVPSGAYGVTVKAYDRSEYARLWSPMSVYTITMFLNGQQACTLKFEALKETGDTLVLTNTEGLTSSQLYAGSDRLFLGEIDLLEGRSTIELVAGDYSGNETTLIRSFIVRDSE